ncbi:MAG: RNA polymerase sigma-70 factor [Spirochaetales bacterium]|nr:RNA polymerase sigma-70 factor [Spirochaetales bacterium]
MATTNPTDEKDLLLGLQNGEHAAFEQLYHRYSKPLYWKINSMVKQPEEADELLQELFVKVWEKRERLNINQSFEAYLYRIAQRMAVDHFRSLETKARLHTQVELGAEKETESAEENYINRETQSLLNDAIAQLPSQRKRAFILCKIEGKSHQEAADLMGISPNTVHNHLVKAVSTVREYLEKSGVTTSPLLLLAVLAPIL